MILELDLGNTRAKWRMVTEQAEVFSKGIAEVADWLRGRFPSAWTNVERIRIASVLSPAIESELMGGLQSAFSVAPVLAKSTAHCCGVRNAYANPERLGVDRWLALIAAYKIAGEAVLVVDVGTALKVDLVNDAGRHIGGYIVPGAALMERSLLEGTDRVRYESDLPIESVALGIDTRRCVQHGVAAALVGAVMVALEQSRAALGKRSRLFITGGGAMPLSERLLDAGIQGIEIYADLVLDGLRWVLSD